MVAESDHQSEQILAEMKSLCLQLELKEYCPSKIVWSRMVPRWGAIDPGEPVLQSHAIYIHKDLGSLTYDELKPLIAFSMARSWKTGKYSKLVGLAILASLFSILVASFLLLPLVLPERVPFSCRGCPELGYGLLGGAITIYIEPIILIFAGIFIGRAYNRKRTHEADRIVAKLLGRDTLLASLNFTLAAVPEPSASSRRADARRIRRQMSSLRNRIRFLQANAS